MQILQAKLQIVYGENKELKNENGIKRELLTLRMIYC